MNYIFACTYVNMYYVYIYCINIFIYHNWDCSKAQICQIKPAFFMGRNKSTNENYTGNSG